MKRNRLSSRKRISADATELGRLATGLADSGGKLEEVFWEKQLVELVEKLLQDSAEDDDDTVAGPISIAVDMNDADPAADQPKS